MHHCDVRFRKRILELSKTCRPTSFPLGFADNVLVYYDGSPAALALLNLTKFSIIERNEPTESASRRNTLKLPTSITIFVILGSFRKI